MNCLACGAANDAQVLFCVRCGAQLRPAPPPESWRYSGDLNRTQVDEPPRAPKPPQQQPPRQQPPPFAPPFPQQQQQPPPSRPPNAHGSPRPVTPLYTPPTPPAPFAPTLSTPPHVATANASGGSQLVQVGMTLSVVVACLTLVGLVPCLGWLNWFTIVGAKAALIICIIGVATEKDPARKSKAMMGLIISAIAFGVILFRLLLSLIFGGGCL